MGWIAAAAQVMRDLVSPPTLIRLEALPEHTFDSTPRPIDQLLASMRDGSSGPISRDAALSVSAVQRGRNELCSLATLPLKLFKGLEVVDSPLFRQFDPDVANVVHLAKTIEDLAFEAVAWWMVTGQDFAGFPMSVRRLEPCKVTLRLNGAKEAGTAAERAEQRKWVYVDFEDGRGPVKVSAALMIRFDSPNPGILTSNARAIRRALALDGVAAMYAANPQLREYFTDSDDPSVTPLDDDEVDAFLAEYGTMRNIRPYGWIPGNVKRADVSAPSPRDLTLVDLQRQVTIEIANGLGVDPEDLGVSTTSRTYQNEDARRRDKINRMYGPFMSAITDRLGMGDVTKRGYAPRFDLTDYLKADPATQITYWQGLMDMGVTDAAEVRGMAGLTGPPPAAAAPAPVATGGLAAAAATSGSRFAAAGPAFQFSAGDFATDTPAPTVDTAARTITGLAVPYGAIATKYGTKVTFAPGSLEYSSAANMPHMMDHVTAVGFHRSITDGAAGPMVELAVLDGIDGSPEKMQRDQLLYDAANGLYSGLSIGVDFSYDEADGDGTYGDDGVFTVTRAAWRETSTTYLPAFDDARVTRVVASLTGGPAPMDPCQHCGKRHAPGIACATFAAQLTPTPPTPAAAATPAAFTPEQLEQFRAMLGGTPAPAEPSPAAIPVSPHHNFAQVTEPLPYRYDRFGNLRAGSHDFSTDVAVAYNPNYDGGDNKQAAEGRIKTWLSYAFGDVDGDRHLGKLDTPGDAAQQRFAITPANVANLNYPANKPDMYVDQLDYQYPMYAEFNKGTLDTVTPFVLPKFSASSGLVADHVTGTEPTPGAFTATSQTVTPSALSGKVEITREVFDQGGNPQASGLIWRQMVRGWYEGIEAAIQAFFVANAASIPDVSLGTTPTDAALDQNVAAAVTSLKYIRGGDRYRKVFTQIDLYQRLAKAVDSTGRPLYPTVGAMNASGTMIDDQGVLNVRGKAFYPEWATAATTAGVASSWMMDPDVVGCWISTPQRLDLQWRVAWVDLGIWGYKALAITDFTRTREITFTR